MNAPVLSEKEQEVVSIWSMLSLPVVNEFGLKNIISACEVERGDWIAIEMQHTILGLNKIYELILEYQRRESYSAKTDGN